MSKNPPKEIKALKAYCAGTWNAADFRAADLDLVHESDRASVILMTVRVEEALRWRLEQAMPGLGTELWPLLFGAQGPLSTFSAQINLARALDLLSDDDAKKLHTLRQVRNECAHTHKHLSFDLVEMRDIVRLLVPPEFIDRMPPLDAKGDARSAFIAVASFFACLFYSDRKTSVEVFQQLYLADL